MRTFTNDRYASLLALLLAPIAAGCSGITDDSASRPEGPEGAAAAALGEEPGLEGDPSTEACAFPYPYTNATSTNVTFQLDATMADLDDDDEKCRLSFPYLAFLVMGGRQIRVNANGRTALCTVDDDWHDGANTLVTMSANALLAKFGTTDAALLTGGTFRTHETTPVDTCGWVGQQLSSITSTPNSTIGVGEFYSAPTASPSNRRVSFTAPHGGAIEASTWEQVQYLHGKHAAAAHFWLFRSISGSAHDRWHVTSNDLHNASFSGLYRIWQGYDSGEAKRDLVVSFHGYDPAKRTNCNDDVVIGGHAPRALRDGFAQAAALWASYRNVTIGTRTDFAGTDCPTGNLTSNFVNRLSDHSEGIQLEQATLFRGDAARREALADAVASYALAYASVTSAALGQQASGASGTGDVSVGAYWNVTANDQVTSSSTYGSCRSTNDRGWADWYAREGSQLVRVGGGPLKCNGSNAFVPDTGFTSVDYTNRTGATVKVRVAGVAYTKSGLGIQLKAQLN